MVRNNPIKNWDYIDPLLKEYYGKRIIFIGPESTGKTTICKRLANEFNTLWVPEYGREYAEKKLIDPINIIYSEWTNSDFEKIAIEQNKMENNYAKKCNKYIFCDTNSFATYIWNLLYTNKLNKKVLNYYLDNKKKYNDYIIFLLKPEVKFVQDGTREFESKRYLMFDMFKKELDKINEEYIIIDGNYNERYEKIKILL